MIELFIHRPPMKGILHAAVRNKYALHTALETVNKEWGTDYTETDIIKWGHITMEEAIKHAEMVKRGGLPNKEETIN